MDRPSGENVVADSRDPEGGPSLLPEVDQALFRSVMGRFVTGVTVLTVDTPNGPRGMTANAFLSASLQPPLCVVSVAKRARILPCLREAGRFGVSILAVDQKDHAVHFSGRPVDGLHPEFEMLDTVPMLSGTVARMAADIEAEHDCGDHVLFVGHVRRMVADERPPLVYYRGGFGPLAGSSADEVPVPEFW